MDISWYFHLLETNWPTMYFKRLNFLINVFDEIAIEADCLHQNAREVDTEE